MIVAVLSACVCLAVQPVVGGDGTPGRTDYRKQLEELRAKAAGPVAWDALMEARELLLKAGEAVMGERGRGIPWAALVDEQADPGERGLAQRGLEEVRKAAIGEVIARVAQAGNVGRPMPADVALVESDLCDLWTLRACCWVNRVDMLQAAEEGRWDAWVDRAAENFAMAKVYSTDTEMVGYLAGVVVCQVTLEDIERVLGRGTVPEAALARLASLLDSSLPLPRPGAAVQGARLMSLASIHATYTRDDPPGMASRQEAVAKTEEFYAGAGRVVGLGFAERRKDAFRFAEFESALDTKRHRVLAVTMPNLPGAIEKMDEVEVEAAGVEVMVALERYRLKHGAYPETLAPLSPAFLRSVPRDPFTGAEMLYRGPKGGPHAGGRAWVVYSAGYDQKDDGGREDTEDPTRAITGRGMAGRAGGLDFIVNPAPKKGE
ncbi:MAG TPA: hypothetical protein VD997_09165 [Phycisphaerales bacterium]|nr:hypothetical protein [Phycisphaerales bacterium]